MAHDSKTLNIHPVQPQARLISKAVAALRAGGIIVYPTDSSYALGCCIGDKEAADRIRALRALDKSHNFTLVCRDLSELATYAIVNNSVFRLLKGHTPGPFTFILAASREVPRRLQHEKRKTIGLRIPDNVIAQALLAELGEPLMSVTLILPPATLPISDPMEDEDVYKMLQRRVDVIVEGGACGFELTTVVDCSGVDGAGSQIMRQGKGMFLA